MTAEAGFRLPASATALVLALCALGCGAPVYHSPARQSQGWDLVGASAASGDGPSLVVVVLEDGRPGHTREPLGSWLAEEGGWTGEAATRDTRWDPPPAVGASEALAATLRADGRFGSVAVSDRTTGHTADFVLTGRLRRLRGWQAYHVRRGGEPEVLASLGDAFLDRLVLTETKTGRVPWRGQGGALFEHTDVPLDPYGQARAALREAVAGVGADLAGASLDRDLAPRVTLAKDACRDGPEAPAGWTLDRGEPATPHGWTGEPRCEAFVLTDPERTFWHARLGRFRPTVRLWRCPADYRADARRLGDDAEAFPAEVLGHDAEGRAVLSHHLGASSWPESDAELTGCLGLTPVYAVSHLGRE